MLECQKCAESNRQYPTMTVSTNCLSLTFRKEIAREHKTRLNVHSEFIWLFMYVIIILIDNGYECNYRGLVDFHFISSTFYVLCCWNRRGGLVVRVSAS